MLHLTLTDDTWKNIEELETLEDKWLFFVQSAGSLDVKPNVLSTVPEINHALEIANEAGLTCAELEAQHKRRDFIMLQRGSIKKALKDGYANGHEKGIKEGIKEGLEKGVIQGRYEERIEIAKRLKASGIAISEISKITKLSEAELLLI